MGDGAQKQALRVPAGLGDSGNAKAGSAHKRRWRSYRAGPGLRADEITAKPMRSGQQLKRLGARFGICRFPAEPCSNEWSRVCPRRRPESRRFRVHATALDAGPSGTPGCGEQDLDQTHHLYRYEVSGRRAGSADGWCQLRFMGRAKSCVIQRRKHPGSVGRHSLLGLAWGSESACDESCRWAGENGESRKQSGSVRRQWGGEAAVPFMSVGMSC